MIDLLALSLLPVWRWRIVSEQLRAGTSAGRILEEQCDLRARRRPGSPGAEALRSLARSALERGQLAGLLAVPWGAPAYPPALAAIVDPPPVLWSRGSLAVLDAPAVAIVGSRAGSPYAVSVAERLSAQLVELGIVVVSGLARGVDSAAHRGALSAHGGTVAVLGCGADRVYPPEHGALAAEIATRGAVVSEFAPGTPPHPRFFPRRNRIISGLSHAVVVVEAGEKSGSLITARCALDQGREVLAVPGNVLNGRNRGGHALLRDGARLVETADDILHELGWERFVPTGGATSAAVKGRRQPRGFDAVLESLPLGESCDLDGMVARTGLAPTKLLSRLLELELLGLVGRAGGGRFVRLDGTC